MSQENVELVRTTFTGTSVDMVELFGGGTVPDGADFSPLAEDVEIVFVGAEPGLIDSSYTGPAGLVEGWQDWLAAWSSYEAQFEEFVDAGDDVVVLVRLRGTTKHGGVVIEQPAAAVWTVEDGKIVRLAFHLSRRAAFESIGRADPSS
jgi:ketosteroid isomerase-like protein